MSNILIAYYSRADENYVNGQMKMLQTGNTECAAQVIADTTGGDMFHIEQLKPYSKNYNDCIHEAQVDQNRTQDLLSQNTRKISTPMTQFTLATQITGAPCRWPSLLFWNILILPEKRFIPSALMKEAALAAA